MLPGQTLFIEPKQILEMNNRLRQQQIAERNEITVSWQNCHWSWSLSP